MKKIWMMLLLISTVFAFAACSDDDDKIPVNPVPGATINSPVKIGETLQVTGKGFVEGAQFYFKNEEWESEAFNANVTASGASLIVPLSIQPGEYTLMLKQDGDWEIGKVTLNKADIPVQGFIEPTTAFIGKTMTIPGAGFNNTSEVYLQQEGSEAIKLTTAEDFSAGLICEIPSDLEAGSYTVIFKQDGGEWTLENELVVEKAPKMLKKITLSVDLSIFGDDIIESASYEIVRKNDEVIGFNIVNIPEETIANYTIEKNNGKIIGTTQDDINTESFTLTLDENKVILTEAYEYTKKENWKTHSREWQYTDEYLNILYDKSYPNDDYPTTKAERVEYKYEGGNLISISENGSEVSTFNYGNAPEYNNNGIEWAACYYALYHVKFPDLLFAIFTNMTGKKSTLLPIQADEGTIDFIYTLDEDKYLTQVNWDGEDGIPVIATLEYVE